MIFDKELDYLVENFLKWTLEQRGLHRPYSEPLHKQDRKALAGFFQPETLDLVRFRRVPKFENPAFYSEIVAGGKPLPMNFPGAHGITFIDTFLINEKYVSAAIPLPLIFHELVHVVQFRFIGTAGFVRKYIEELIKNNFHSVIVPLERTTLELSARFKKDNFTAFSVEAEILADMMDLGYIQE